MFNKKTVKDISLRGKRVLLRADYNVPIKDGKISSDYRLRKSLPTINYILSQKPAGLVIISHLGRPKAQPDASLSLRPVAQALSKLLDRRVLFTPDCVGGPTQQAAASLKGSDVLVLENLRFHEGEEQNDPTFAKALLQASGAKVFVQDGFGVIHRAHASTEALTKLLPSVAGLLIEQEVDAISKISSEPDRPLMAVIGGAKISDKIAVLSKFISTADCVAVVGALANNFLAGNDVKVGKSLIDPDAMHETEMIWNQVKAEEKKRPFSFLIPVDAVVSKSIDGRSSTRIVDISSNTLADIEAYPKKPDHSSHTVAHDELILDIGPISAATIAGAIELARTVVWGGTCGVTETRGIAGAPAPFAHGSRVIAEAMIDESNFHKNKPFSVVGGGDTIGFVESEGLPEDFSHVSTGGSASLDLLSGKKLPGLEALMDKKAKA